MTLLPDDGGAHVTLALGAYVLGALGRDEDQEVADHLALCDACCAEYLDLTETQSLLSMVSEADLWRSADD
ncbi:zf-HC2 domain-containing protein [Streptomyces sp. NPDC001941]|uniref:zf-HC2 domain-containing protein n=1 Tax=Streptomyces sp. NPDC001941 TaxID=3154659 RepID=UPI00331ADE2B